MFRRRTPAAALLSFVAALCATAALAGAAPAGAACTTGFAGTIGVQTTYGYCGSEQSFIASPGTTGINVTVIGGAGGGTSSGNYGLGGRVVATNIPVTAGHTYYVYVGGNGASGGGTNAGGYNGGAIGYGPGGGGASDIRTVSCGSDCPGDPASSTIASRLVIGAGGGGGVGGDGGSQSNGNGSNGTSPPSAGSGGTQTAGGAAGSVPNVGSSGTGTKGSGGVGTGPGCGGGGGGGGLYGGGGGMACVGGGGGSSFGPAGSTFSSTTSAATVQITPTGTPPPIVASTTLLASSANPSASGDAVTFTATVSSSGGPAGYGTVQFYDGATPIGSPVSVNPANGQAAVTTNPVLTVGNHTITASYGGAANFGLGTSTSSPLTQVVNPPAAPTLSSTNPASPSSATSIRVLGTGEAGSTVKLYTTNDCSGTPAASGTAAAFASPGLPVTVTANATTTFRATVTDAGGSSNCSTSSISYANDSTPPARPTFSSSTPASPAQSTTPNLLGTAETSSTVRLYATSDCSGSPTATGTAATFASPGIAVTVTANSTTTFHATATDGVGNVSPCSTDAFTYVNDTTPPAAPTFSFSNPASPAQSTTPKILGTGEAGSTVKLFTTIDCSGSATATGTAATFASPGVDVTVPANSSTTFHATATDAAGNTSSCSTGSLTYVNDTTPPAKPTFTSSDPASPAQDTTPKILGDAETGSTVKLYTANDCSGSATATGTAATFASPGIGVTVPANSSTTFHATATDAAGNTSACSTDTLTYVNDTTAPAAPTFTASDPASPAQDTTPKILGTAEANSTVKLYATGDCSGGTAATGTAATFAASGLGVTVPANSSTTFHATTTDPSGNTSACSTDSLTYVNDTTAPAKPTFTSSDPASPAQDTTPEILGGAESGSTVKLYASDDCTGPAVTGTAATFASPGIGVTVAANSSTTFHATATDAAGNTSACSTDALTYVNDTTAPAAPTFSSSDPASPAQDTTPEILGGAESGATVKLYTSDDCTGPAVTGTAAAFATPGLSVTVPANNSTTFHATATDAAGNTSACSTDSLTYVNDTTAPAKPTFDSSDPASPAQDTTPKILGDAESGSTVKLYTTNDCTGSATATDTAATFASPGIGITVTANSSTTFHATATDAAGNTSACSTDSLTYINDTTPPAAPTFDSSDPGSPAQDTTPKILGDAESGSTVKLYTTNDCTGSATATDTAATFASPGIGITVTANSSTTFHATATDPSGNTSACSTDSLTYINDTTPPAAPTFDSSDPASPAQDTTPKILGTAETGSTVKLYTTNDCTGSATATDTAATFASPGIGVTVPANSSTTFHATATDPSGNTSACSTDTLTYVNDTTAPAAPTFTASDPASPAQDTTPNILGDAESGSTVKLYTTNDCTGSATATDTAATFASPGIGVTVPADAPTTFYATATDAAGNTSACSTDSLTYVNDTTPPAAPTFDSSDPASPAQDTTPKILGTAETGSTVKLYTTNDCTGSATATDTAATFASPGIGITVTANSSTTFHATATDAAGNTSSCSTDSLTYVNDTDAPNAPTFAGSDPASPSTSTTPRLLGTAEAGSTVRLYTTADCSGAAAAAGTAADFASPGLPVTVAVETTTTFRATATDPSGNTSACSTDALAYRQDDNAPAAPSGLATDPASPNRSTTPRVRGIAEEGTTVRVYTNATCSGSPVATGSASDFAAPGLTVAVAENTTTTLHATATDVVGNVSACSDGRAYVNDSVFPVLTGIALAPRCLGTGTGAASTLKVSYTLNVAAKVTFTLQRRTSNPPTPRRRCPKPLAATDKSATYTEAATSTKDATAGSGYATVTSSGAVTRRAGASAAKARRTLATTIAAKRGRNRTSVLRAADTSRLTPGRYRLLVQATRADGTASRISVLYLWVLAPARR